MIEKAASKCKCCDGTGLHWMVNPDSLKRIRRASGLSLREFAKKLGFSAPYISDIENGRRACTPAIEGAYSELNGEKEK